jgi:hypothetical protein
MRRLISVPCVLFVLFSLFALPGCIPDLTPAEQAEVAAIQARSDAAARTLKEAGDEIKAVALAMRALLDAVKAGQLPVDEGKKLIDALDARIPALEAKVASATADVKAAGAEMNAFQEKLAARGASEFGSVVATGLQAAKTGSPAGVLVTIGIAVWQAILRKRAQREKARSEAGFGVVSRAVGDISGSSMAAAIKAELASEDTEISRAELDALVAKAKAEEI